MWGLPCKQGNFSLKEFRQIIEFFTEATTVTTGTTTVTTGTSTVTTSLFTPPSSEEKKTASTDDQTKDIVIIILSVFAGSLKRKENFFTYNIVVLSLEGVTLVAVVILSVCLWKRSSPPDRPGLEGLVQRNYKGDPEYSVVEDTNTYYGV